MLKNLTSGKTLSSNICDVINSIIMIMLLHWWGITDMPNWFMGGAQIMYLIFLLFAVYRITKFSILNKNK